jgi:hypothetical protein
MFLTDGSSELISYKKIWTVGIDLFKSGSWKNYIHTESSSK